RHFRCAAAAFGRHRGRRRSLRRSRSGARTRRRDCARAQGPRMSALPKFAGLRLADTRGDVAIVLLGTGVVGGALLRSLSSGGHGSRRVGLANSTRQCADAAGFDIDAAPALLARAEVGRSDDALLAALDASGAGRRVVVDATASPETASRHAEWLARGY